VNAAFNATIDRMHERALRLERFVARSARRKRGNGYRWPHFRTLLRLYTYKQQCWRTP